ncbi:hypothetical protein EGYY_23920 [Eggerthella sp. YY7918]|nr:hypothetical protein EGYY_23920 [Eggerthella sp. YY7918]
MVQSGPYTVFLRKWAALFDDRWGQLVHYALQESVAVLAQSTAERTLRFVAAAVRCVKSGGTP